MRRSHLVLAGVALPLLVVVSAARSATTPPRTSNAPPVVTVETENPEPWLQSSGGVERIRIRVVDPDGDRVSAALAAAPSFQGFRPILSEPSGAEREVIWYLHEVEAGTHDFIVRAWDDAQPERSVTHRASVLVLGSNRGRTVCFHDVTGDGVEELFANVQLADVGGVVDAGAIALFDEYGLLGAGPAPTLLTGATVTAGALVGSSDGGGSLEWADVTGDGVEELIGRDAAGLLVWSRPKIGGVVRPLATLRSTDPSATFHGSGTDFLVADVTGDGIRDIVAVASLADVGGVADVGEICVFAGGPTLTGTPAATALLRIPGAVAGDQLGALIDAASGLPEADDEYQGVVVADVTGDGLADIVAGAAPADLPLYKNAGRGFVWAGGPTLVGIPLPRATLDSNIVRKSDYAGGDGLHVVDLTGDGIRDVVLDSIKVKSGGAILLFEGGATLTGSVSHTARLAGGTGVATAGTRTRFVDLDRDGVLDVLSSDVSASVGGVIAGALLFWRGGSHLGGRVDQDALLTRPTPVLFDNMGNNVELVDVTGDGELDILSWNYWCDGAAVDSGAIQVWVGRGGFSGTVPADAELQVPWAVQGDHLTSVAKSYYDARGVLIVDVTGDGIRDVVAVAPEADVGALVDVGRAYVWKGGPALASGGVVGPIATLKDTRQRSQMMLGFVAGGGFALQAGDVTGDGILDVVVTVSTIAGSAPIPSNVFAHLVVFQGGTAMAGAPAPWAVATSDQSYDDMASHGADLVLADIDGDLVTDLEAHASRRDFDPISYPGITETGALLLFRGGLPGTPDPIVYETNLAVDYSNESSRFLMPRDVTSDGLLDLALLQPRADFPGFIWWEVGRLLLWRGRNGKPGRNSDDILYGTLPGLPPGMPDRGMGLEPEIASPADLLGYQCRMGG